MRLLQAFSLIFALLMVAGCSPSSIFGENKPQSSVNPIDDRPVVFDLNSSIEKINDVRRKYFLAPIKLDSRLLQAAENHAQLMSRTGKFGHEFGPSTKFQRRIFSVGFKNSAGENLGVGYRSIDAAIDGWLNSPGHRKILLKRNYSLGGLAYAPNRSGKNPRLNHFWVLIVGAED